MLWITRDAAGRGLVEFGRIAAMLDAHPRPRHIRAERVTPLRPETGRVPVGVSGHERLLEDDAVRLFAESGRDTASNLV